MKDVLRNYLSATSASLDQISDEFIAYLSNLVLISRGAPEIAQSIVKELEAQRTNLKLIASENYSSITSQVAMGNLLTDKYAEGVPARRFYAGCNNVDDIESYAAEQACAVFGSEHAYVQPHSGADANLIAYWAILNKRVQTPLLEKYGTANPSDLSQEQWNDVRKITGNQRLLGMDYYSGGHLTHGYRLNVSAQMFDAYSYGVNRETGLIDYKEIESQVKKIKPLILLAGYSAYPRKINFRRMREIADTVDAVLMVDMAHFGGLVAGGIFTGDYDPVPFSHVVTSTTHKTLKGPRGGLILCCDEFRETVDKGCPLVIGGPLPHMMAAKGVALREANTEDFRSYSRKIVENAYNMAEECKRRGMTLATDGTDNHLFLIDVFKDFGLTGRQGESALRECSITLNRNSLPYDPNGAWYTSGLRMGTPAVTTLGMGKSEVEEIADIIHLVLSSTQPAVISSGERKGQTSRTKYIIDEKAKAEAKSRVHDLLGRFPVYPEIDLEYLKKKFYL